MPSSDGSSGRVGAEPTPEARARLAAIDAAIRSGRGASVADEAAALVDAFPESNDVRRAYLLALLAWAQRQPGLAARAFPPPPDAGRPAISIVVCSIDRGKFDAVTASYRARFAGYPLEILGVHDARSLAEGYNRAASRATGEILVFSHDDIELVTPDFAGRLCAHLARHDVVGVAGASRIAGPRWGHAGQRHVHGHVLHVPPDGKPGALLMAAGFQSPVCEGIRVLDGVFLAMRRHVWASTRFDAGRYDGFHLYDLDFTRRASDAGARLAVPLDLLLLHRSMGHYGAEWRRYADVFAAQAGVDPRAKEREGGLQVRLETHAQIDAMRAALLHFRYGAPVGPASAGRSSSG